MVLKVAEYVNIALWICYNCCTILFKIIWAHNKEASVVTVLRFLLFPMPAVLFFMKMSNWQRASSYIIRVHKHFSQTSLCCLESFSFFCTGPTFYFNSPSVSLNYKASWWMIHLLPKSGPSHVYFTRHCNQLSAPIINLNFSRNQPLVVGIIYVYNSLQGSVKDFLILKKQTLPSS